MELHELKEYLDEKFEMNNEVLNEKFSKVDLQLGLIKEQTTKTNGRVNRLEIKMEETERYNSMHIASCPIKKELDDYKTQMGENLFLFTFLRKYPKTSTIIGAILVSLIAAGGLEKALAFLGL